MSWSTSTAIQFALPALQAGLVGSWAGDGNYDDSAGGNTGSPVGGTTFVTGPTGEAFSFDGSGQAVALTNTPALQLQNFTIDAWVKRASTAVASNDERGGPGGLIFSYGYGGYGLGIFDNGDLFLSDIGIRLPSGSGPRPCRRPDY